MKKQGTWLLNNFNISCNLNITASILTLSRLLCIFLCMILQILQTQKLNFAKVNNLFKKHIDDYM